MNRISFWLAAAVSSSVLTATSAFAATQQLGVQDFVDGTSTILLTDFMGTGDSFNQFQGVDAKWVPEDITEPASTTATGNWGWEWNYSARRFEWVDNAGDYMLEGSLGQLSYSHSLNLENAVGPATIEFGLYDADLGSSALLADEMISIMLNGVQYTPTGDWLPVQTGISSYHVVSFDIDLSFFDAAGNLDVDIWAIGHGTCVDTPVDSARDDRTLAPQCVGNGIGIDYSVLTVQTVPLPASGLFLIAGLGALALKRRRKG